ncbi:zinc finger SWIM domain-containing protein 7 isoform X2 [Meles meles]|uniref:zinc finger SWIM domain-containing protein 7 isoform X2 n=1 Tax=Meles meles TaxID=9662 RepID=UPI001E69ACEC|nr:zinc finger SWIM domain-containing protein 7 isoform X2 [Meles meles]
MSQCCFPSAPSWRSPTPERLHSGIRVDTAALLWSMVGLTAERRRMWSVPVCRFRVATPICPAKVGHTASRYLIGQQRMISRRHRAQGTTDHTAEHCNGSREADSSRKPDCCQRPTVQVLGSSGKTYTCLASCHYCSCPAFAFSVLRKSDSLLCKHLLAVYLGQVMGTCRRLQVSDEQLTGLLVLKKQAAQKL